MRVVIKASLRSSRERRVVRFDVVYGPDAASSDLSTCISKPPELGGNLLRKRPVTRSSYC